MEKHVGMIRFIVAMLCWGCLSWAPLSASFRYRLSLVDKADSECRALSPRALERRAKQGIAIDSTDYALSSRYLSALESAGLTICSRSHWLNSVVVMSTTGEEIAADFWANFPFVKQVETVTTTEKGLSPIHRIEKHRSMPVDMNAESMVSVIPSDDFRAPMYQVHGEALYDAGHRGAGMLVAVVDGGFHNIHTFPWLYDRVVGARDMYAPADSLSLFAAEIHGAQVFSVMASDSAHGIWGTACEADYFLIRSEFAPSETPFEEDQWVAALELADSLGVDVVNSSLGYFMFDNSTYNHSHDDFAQGRVFVSRGARLAAEKGMLLCVAAGNERSSSWQRIIFPADVEEVLSVGAVDGNGQPTYFTCLGFLSPYVKPDVSCRGQQSFVIDTSTGLPTFNGGTSFASPFLCGLATSLWGAYPMLSAAQVRDIVRRSASDYLNPNTLTGYGLPDFSIALSEARALAGGAAIESLFTDKTTTSHKGIFDLSGRPLSVRPSQGLYIENGRLRHGF